VKRSVQLAAHVTVHAPELVRTLYPHYLRYPMLQSMSSTSKSAGTSSSAPLSASISPSSRSTAHLWDARDYAGILQVSQEEWLGVRCG